MNGPERLDLAVERGIKELLAVSFNVYRRNFGVVFALALAVVAPVQLIVSGIGLEELTAPYRESPDAAELLIPTGVGYLVIAPLIAAATIHLLQQLAAGKRPHPGSAIQAGLDVFAPVFLAVVLAGVVIAAGLIALIVPGVFLAIRLYFVPQVVVIDGARVNEALRATWRTTRGYWWRTFAVVVLANVAAFVPASLLVLPLQSLAEAADRQALALVGTILSQSLVAPFVAIVSTLLFFDVRARRAASPESASSSSSTAE